MMEVDTFGKEQQQDRPEASPSRRNSEDQSCNARIWIKTAALVVVWMNFGMVYSILPATLPDMITRFNVTVEEMSRALMAVSYGGIIGGPFGVFIDRFHSKGDFILGVMLLCNSVIVCLKPWIPRLVILATLNFLDGLIWTAINAVGNAMLVNLWGKKNSSPMQALHLGFPLGSMIASLIALPFVTKHDPESENPSQDSPYSLNTSNVSFTSELEDFNFTSLPPFISSSTEESAKTYKRFLDDSQIEIAYCLIGIFVFLTAFTFFMFQCAAMPTTGHGISRSAKTGLSWKQVFSPSTWSPSNSRFGVTLVIAMMFFYFLQYGTIVPSMLFQVQFAVDANFTTEQGGALMSSTNYLAGTFGRAVSIIIARFVPSRIMLFAFVSGETLTALLIVICGFRSSTIFWIFGCMYAFFRDPIWPCGYTWMDQYIHLFALVVGLLDAASRISAALMSWLMGYTYTYTSIYSIYYISAGLGVLLSIHLLLVNMYAGRHDNKYILASQTSTDMEKTVQGQRKPHDQQEELLKDLPPQPI